MSKMAYEKFIKKFDNLKSNIHKNIIECTLVNMHHCLSKEELKKVDIKNGIVNALMDKDMTVSDMFQKILLKNEIYDSIENIQNSYYKLLERNSKHGNLYKDILEVLEITQEDIIRCSLFFQEKCFDKKWLFDSLLEADQNALFSLAMYLDTPPTPLSSYEPYICKSYSCVGVTDFSKEDIPFS